MKDCEIFQTERIRNLSMKERLVLYIWKIWQSFVEKEWKFQTSKLKPAKVGEILTITSSFQDQVLNISQIPTIVKNSKMHYF